MTEITIHTARPVRPLSPDERRALEALSQRDAICRVMGHVHVVIARKRGVSLRVASIADHVVARLRRQKWVQMSKAEHGLVITAAGRHQLRITPTPADFQATHQTREQVTNDEGVQLMINRDEGPLSRLQRMKKPDGSPFIDAGSVEAGERFAADFMRAGMVPGITMRWDATGISGEANAHPTELMLAARQRVTAALDWAGPDFAGLLIDVLAFGKGLEDIERERHWPQRSGKIVVALALKRLASHYGLAAEARGSDVTRGRVWRAPDGRPSL